MSSLLKELLKNESQITESKPSLTEIDKFHKSIQHIEGLCYQIDADLKDGSQFRALIKNLQSDESFVNDALRGLNRLLHSLEELHRFTDTQLQRSDENDD